MKLFNRLLFLGVLSMMVLSPQGFAGQGTDVIVTMIGASNEGSDFDLDNDVHRDKLIELFSYSSYKQIDQEKVHVSMAESAQLKLPNDYILELQVRGEADREISIRALILSQGKTYLDTILTLQKPGVVFLGGPTLGKDVLVLVLEPFLAS